MNTPEEQSIITGIPDHLRPKSEAGPEVPAEDSAENVVDSMADTAMSGGRFGRGTVELHQVGPHAIRDAARVGTLESLGGDRYAIPAQPVSPETDDSTPLTSNSAVRERAVDTPHITSTGAAEYPEDL